MYATSPDRFSFMIEGHRRRLESNPKNIEILKTIELYEECRRRDAEDIPKSHDLEYDLRKCKFVVSKCKASTSYSQNMYAALCNNSFIREGKEWNCSWRSAAGIVSNLREQGDYIDWYCSGIGSEDEDSIFFGDYLPEGTVDAEILSDLRRLGWDLSPDINDL